GDRGDGSGSVAADSRDCLKDGDVVGQSAREALDHSRRPLAKHPRPPVVAQSRPRRSHLLFARRGQCPERGEARHKVLIARKNNSHPRLLQHHLRYPDPVWIIGGAPRQCTLMAGKPGFGYASESAGRHFAVIVVSGPQGHEWTNSCRLLSRKRNKESTSTASSRPRLRASSARWASVG